MSRRHEKTPHQDWDSQSYVEDPDLVTFFSLFLKRLAATACASAVIARLVCVLLILCLGAQLHAGDPNDFYIDTEVGSNANNGSSASPWQDFSPVPTQTFSGDVIHLVGTSYLAEELFAAPWLTDREYRSGGISQYGVTWIFDGEYLIGRFINGDYWVLDSGSGVVISETLPDPNQVPGDVNQDGEKNILDYGPMSLSWQQSDCAPENLWCDHSDINQDGVVEFLDFSSLLDDWLMPGLTERHGSMINPVTGFSQGYDFRLSSTYYDTDLRVDFPKRIFGGASLVSTVSLKDADDPVQDLIGVTLVQSPHFLESAAVLTCVSSVPPVDAFRPPYAGSYKPVYTRSDIDEALLVKLTPPQLLSDPNYDFEDMDIGRLGRDPSMSVAEQFQRILQRPWLFHITDFAGRSSHPIQNMPNYHSDVYRVIQEAALLVMLDLDSIDSPGELDKILIPFIQLGIDSHHVTTSNVESGADSSIHKWPILFAGLLLDDPNMQATDYIFRTDWMTYYVDEGVSQIASQFIPSGQVHTRYCDGNDLVPAFRQDPGDMEHEHLDPLWEWHLVPNGGGSKRESYRIINSPGWVGPALAAILMQAEARWNHPAFFDYVDRWREEGGTSTSDFVDSIWDSYRKYWIPIDPNEPLAPSNLSSTALTEHTIELAWDAAPVAADGDSATAYQIYREGECVGRACDTKFIDKGLDHHTTFGYQIFSLDDYGNESLTAAIGDFTTLEDTVDPNIISVTATENELKIVFSEPLDLASSQDPNNYIIEPNVVVNVATLGTDQVTVVLKTTSHTVENNTLTAASIKDLAGNALPQTLVAYDYYDTPILHLTFDEGQGNGLQDSSIYHNQVWSPPGQGPSSTTGIVNEAIKFDGEDDLIVVDHANVFDLDRVTVAAWIFRHDSVDSRVVCKANGTSLSNHIFSLGVDSAGGPWSLIRARITTNSGSRSANSVGRFYLNTWVHVAFTYDKQAIRLYINGQLDSVTEKNGSIIDQDIPVVIGNVNLTDDRYFNGLIDDVRIYNRALSDSEILDLANPLLEP